MNKYVSPAVLMNALACCAEVQGKSCKYCPYRKRANCDRALLIDTITYFAHTGGEPLPLRRDKPHFGCPHCNSPHLSLTVFDEPLRAILSCDRCGESFEVTGGRLSEVSVENLLLLWQEVLGGSHP